MSPTRASPLRRMRAVLRPASEGPAGPSPTVPGIRSTRTLSPQGMPGPTGLLEAMSIRMDVLESTLQPDTVQTLLQLESRLHTYMEDVQQRFAVAEATYAQYMAPILEKCQEADAKHAELQQKIIATSERLTDLEVEIRSMKVRLREQPPSMPHPEQTAPRQFNMGTPPESVGLPQSFPTAESFQPRPKALIILKNVDFLNACTTGLFR